MRVDVVETFEEVIVDFVELWFISHAVKITGHRERGVRSLSMDRLQKLAYDSLWAGPYDCRRNKLSSRGG
jgi:hypothetical protein